MRLNLIVYHPHKSNRNRLINGKQIIDFYLYYQSGQLYRTFSGDVRAGHMLLVGRFRRIGQYGIQYLSIETIIFPLWTIIGFKAALALLRKKIDADR